MRTRAASIWCRPASVVHEPPPLALARLLASEGCRSRARQVFFAWPNLAQACLRCTAHLTGHYPGVDGGSLLATVFRGCIKAYSEADPGLETAPATAFLECLLDVVPGVLQVPLKGERSGGTATLWDPLREGVPEWVRRERIARLRWGPPGATPTSGAPGAYLGFVLRAHLLQAVDLRLLRPGT